MNKALVGLLSIICIFVIWTRFIGWVEKRSKEEARTRANKYKDHDSV